MTAVTRRALGLAAALACGRQEPPPPQGPPVLVEAPPAVVEAAPPGPTPVPAATPAAPAGPPGPAYFAVDGVGLVRLDDGEFSLVGDAPKQRVVDLVRGGDGHVWLAGSSGVLRLAGDRLREVAAADFTELGAAVDHLAVAADGHVWVATFRGVGEFDGRAWRVTPKEQLGAGEDLLQGIVARAGKVWVASTHALHLREGDAWRTVDLRGGGRPSQPFFQALRPGPDGSVYLLASSALLRVGPGVDEVTPIGLGSPGFVSYADLAASDNGALVVRDGDSVTVVPPGGLPRHLDGRTGADFLAHDIRAVAIDDGGRAWVGSQLGVVVLGPGDEKTEWPRGSVPELAGTIDAMLVLGAGPARLPAAGPVRTGTLTGKLLRGGAGLAGASIELCPSPSMMFHESPCADSPLKFAAVADANGVWTVERVPLGAYGIAVKVDERWRVTLGERLGEGMQADRVFDTGSLILDR